jgi:hypothetical protein
VVLNDKHIFFRGKLIVGLPLLFVVSQAMALVKFDLLPLKVSFYGAVNVKTNIIVYGDFGTYLHSTDLGKTWVQKFIGRYDVIRDMVNFNDTIFGVMYNGFVVMSTDGGENWFIKKFQIDTSEKFLRILVTDNAMYIRGIHTLWKLDRSFNILKELRSFIFEPTLNILTEGNQDEVVSPVNNYVNDEMYLFGSKLILNSDSFGDSGFVAVDLDLQNIEQIVLINRFKTWSSSYLRLIKILNFGEKQICLINRNLYYTDSSFTDFNYFFKDSLYMNFDTTYDGYKKWLFTVGDPELYFTIGDTLFIGGRSDSTKVDTIYYPDGKMYFRLYYRYGIYSVKKYISNPKDTFVVQGYPFCDVYNASNYCNAPFYTTPWQDMFMKLTTPNLVVNDSIWIFVERNRFLLITTDKGYTWNLISYLAGIPRVILHDSTYFFVLQAPKVTEVNRTNNGGLFFQPSKAYLDGYEYKRYISWFYALPLFYVDSTGRGFLKGNFKAQNGNRIYYTYDFWNTYNSFPDSFFVPIGSYYQLIEDYPSNIIRLNSGYLFGISWFSSSERKYYSQFVFLDSSLKGGRKIKGEGFKILYILSTDEISNFIYFCVIQDTLPPFNVWLEIRLTTDTGKTFITLNKIYNLEGQILQFYQHNADSVFFTTSDPDRLYLYDVPRNELKLLWQSEESDAHPLLMVISDRFYIVGWGLFLENTDRSDLTQWREGEWDYGKPYFESVIFKGNVAIAGLSDSLRPFNYYKITLKSGGATGVEEPVVEKRYYSTKFWASEAYPVPGSVKVKARIVWDRGIDIGSAIDGVYDSMGRKVEGRERIEIREESGGGRGEVEWVCEGVPGGVYFIVFRWEGGSEAIPVVVE